MVPSRGSHCAYAGARGQRGPQVPGGSGHYNTARRLGQPARPAAGARRGRGAGHRATPRTGARAVGEGARGCVSNPRDFPGAHCESRRPRGLARPLDVD